MKQQQKPVEKKHHWIVLFLFTVIVLVGVGLYFFKQGTFDALVGEAGRQKVVVPQSPPTVAEPPLNPEIRKLPVEVEDDSQSIILANNFKQFSGSPKPTTFTACPWSFLPSGNSWQLPNGFALSELHLAGVVCSGAKTQCSYSSEKIESLQDMFSTSTLYSIKTKALVGSTSISAVAPQGETWSNCQNDVYSGSLGCRCELG